MKKSSNHWLWSVVSILAFPGVALSSQPQSQVQDHKMSSDFEQGSRREEKRITLPEKTRFTEPLLFGMEENLPPAAMLQDHNESPDLKVSESLKKTKKPLPSEP